MSKITGTQEINGPLFVKNIGGYSGNNPQQGVNDLYNTLKTVTYYTEEDETWAHTWRGTRYTSKKALLNAYQGYHQWLGWEESAYCLKTFFNNATTVADYTKIITNIRDNRSCFGMDDTLDEEPAKYDYAFGVRYCWSEYYLYDEEIDVCFGPYSFQIKLERYEDPYGIEPVLKPNVKVGLSGLPSWS